MCGAGRGLGRGEGRCFRLRLTSWRTENFDCEVTGYTEDGNKCGLLVMRCLLTDAKINRCKSNKWPVADKSSNKDVLNQLRSLRSIHFQCFGSYSETNLSWHGFFLKI